MSLHFLIDGYNVIRQSRYLKNISASADVRSCLVKIIQEKRLAGSRNNRVTIVFDGRSNVVSYNAQGNDQIKIVFSKEDSADEIIKRIVSNASNPKQIVVVSNDRQIISFSKSLGAKTMSVDEFLKEEEQSRQKRQEPLKVGLTYQQQETIDQELRRLWL